MTIKKKKIMYTTEMFGIMIFEIYLKKVYAYQEAMIHFSVFFDEQIFQKYGNYLK